MKSNGLRVHIGLVAGCGQVESLLEDVNQQLLDGGQCFWVGDVTRLGKLAGRQAENLYILTWQEFLASTPHQYIQTPDALVALSNLSVQELNAEEHALLRGKLKEYLQACKVSTTLDLVAVNVSSAFTTPTYDYADALTIPAHFLRQHVADYILCDVPPAQILNLYYQDKLPIPGILTKHARQSIFTLMNLTQLREGLFGMVGMHVTDKVKNLKPDTEPETWAKFKKPLELSRHILGVILFMGAIVGACHWLWISGLLTPSAAGLVLLGSATLLPLYVGWAASIIGSAMAFLGYNYFFFAPYGRITIDSGDDMITLFVFVMVSCLLTCVVTRRELGHKGLNIGAARRQAMLRMVHDLNHTQTANEIILSGVDNLKRTLGADCFFIKYNADINTNACTPTDVVLTGAERKVWQKMLRTQRLEINPKDRKQIFYPVLAHGQLYGALVFRHLNTPMLSHNLGLRNYLISYCELLANGLARIQLTHDIRSAGVEATREKIRSTLLSSISHDLKTPLVSIKGGLQTVRDLGDKLDAKDRSELLDGVWQESDRLHNMIDKILELIRLEAGAVQPKRDAVSVLQSVKNVIEVVQDTAPNLKINLPNTDYDVAVDALLFEKILQNIIENAIKYGGNPPQVKIEIKQKSGTVMIALEDNGKGISVTDQTLVFDKFNRLKEKDSKTGTGLGLNIAQTIAHIHDGKLIAVAPKYLSGARFELTLPAAETKNILTKEENKV